MKLYIANCTHQYHVLKYRLIENRNPLTQTVDVGRQVCVANTDLTQPQVESVIEQFRKYGLLKIDEIGKSRKQIPFVASIDKPIKLSVIENIIKHNDGVLRAWGEDLRQAAAIATNNQISEMAPAAAETLEMTIQEEKPGGIIEENPVNKTYGFKEGPDAPSPSRRGRKAA